MRIQIPFFMLRFSFQNLPILDPNDLLRFLRNFRVMRGVAVSAWALPLLVKIVANISPLVRIDNANCDPCIS